MNIFDIALKNILRRRARAAFILAGLLIGVATVVAVITFTQSTAHDLLNHMEKYGANILILPHTEQLNLSYGDISIGGVSLDVQSIRHSELEKIGAIPNAANIAAVGPALYGIVSIDTSRVLLAGMDFNTNTILKPWWALTGRAPGSAELLLGAESKRILGLGIGDNLFINGHPLSVAGVLAPTGSQDDHLVFTPLETAQTLLGKPDQISMVEVAALCHGCPVEEMVAQIQEQLPSTKVMAIQQVVNSRLAMLEHFKRFSYSLALVVVLAGGLVVLVTLMGSVKERTAEIGILRAVGFRRSHIMRIIFLEAGTISLLAGLLGYLVGMAGIALGMRLLAEPAAAAIHFDPALAAGAISMAIVVGLISGAYPATLAARMDPNQALREL